MTFSSAPRTELAGDTGSPGSSSIAKVSAAAIVVIVPLIAAAWLPPHVPHVVRQLFLTLWGVGAILLAERMLFSDTMGDALRALGWVRARRATLRIALLASLPMWVFLPLFAASRGSVVDLRPDWLQLLLGVVLVNGITEEVIHRGFVFGHLRSGRTFASAAALSATIFAAQHLYLVATIGWTAGLASVVLAALLTFPLAFVFERGGRSLGGPAILHTSSNAPVLVLAFSEDVLAAALLPHMVVVLLSLYLVFVLSRRKREPGLIPGE